MEVNLEPVLAAKVEQWSARTGRATGELVEDALAGFLSESGQLQDLLDCRYDEIASGKVQLVDGDEARRILKDRAAGRLKSIA